MKRRITAMTVALVAIAFLVGCAGVPKVKVPEVIPEKHGELTYLYLTTDAKKMTGVAQNYAIMTVGESIIVYARGGDETGKWFELPADVVVNWKPGRELEVTPTTGHVVTVKAIGPAGEIPFLEVTATTQDGKKIEGTMQIEIK